MKCQKEMKYLRWDKLIGIREYLLIKIAPISRNFGVGSSMSCDSHTPPFSEPPLHTRIPSIEIFFMHFSFIKMEHVFVDHVRPKPSNYRWSTTRDEPPAAHDGPLCTYIFQQRHGNFLLFNMFTRNSLSSTGALYTGKHFYMRDPCPHIHKDYITIHTQFNNRNSHSKVRVVVVAVTIIITI